MRRPRATGLVVLLAFFLAPVGAQSETLLNLISTSGTFTSGNLLFSNFSETGTSDFTVLAVSVSGNPGIDLQSGSFILPGLFSNIISFDVTVTDPNFLIHDFAGSWSPAPIGSGSLLITDVAVGLGTATNSWPTGSLTGNATLSSNVTSLHFRREIQLQGPFTVAGPVDRITTFSEIAAVPEPTTLLLLGSGLVGLAAWRRRKAV